MSAELKEYLDLWEQLQKAEDEVVRESIREKMWKLWYYYLSPADKRKIENGQT